VVVLWLGCHCLPSVNTICGRVMIGLSLLSSVSKHNMWSYYDWAIPNFFPEVIRSIRTILIFFPRSIRTIPNFFSEVIRSIQTIPNWFRNYMRRCNFWTSFGKKSELHSEKISELYRGKIPKLHLLKSFRTTFGQKFCINFLIHKFP
jgi:hypothetical protein